MSNASGRIASGITNTSFRARRRRRTRKCAICVHYVPPLGPLGAIAEPAPHPPQLERIFDFREQQITRSAADARRRFVCLTCLGKPLYLNPQPQPGDALELKDIKAIIDLMKKNDLSVFELERDGFKLKLQKGAGEQTVFTAPMPALAPIPLPMAAPLAAAAAPAAPAPPAPAEPRRKPSR